MAVLEKFVDYSDSLAGIVDRATGTQEDVASVATSARRLAQFTPAEFGGPAVPDLLISAFESAAKEAVKISAASDLASAVEKAQPVVAGLADALSKDLESLSATLSANRAAARQGVDIPLADFIAYQNVLLEDRRQLVANLPARDKEDLRAAALDRVRRVEELLQLTANDRAALDRRRIEVSASIDQDIELVARSRTALRAWKVAHADLADAIRQGRSPNVRNLKLAVDELAGLIEKGQKAFGPKEK
jgi:hypothetical protein